MVVGTYRCLAVRLDDRLDNRLDTMLHALGCWAGCFSEKNRKRLDQVIRKGGLANGQEEEGAEPSGL